MSAQNCSARARGREYFYGTHQVFLGPTAARAHEEKYHEGGPCRVQACKAWGRGSYMDALSANTPRARARKKMREPMPPPARALEYSRTLCALEHRVRCDKDRTRKGPTKPATLGKNVARDPFEQTTAQPQTRGVRKERSRRPRTRTTSVKNVVCRERRQGVRHGGRYRPPTKLFRVALCDPRGELTPPTRQSSSLYYVTFGKCWGRADVLAFLTILGE